MVVFTITSQWMSRLYLDNLPLDSQALLCDKPLKFLSAARDFSRGAWLTEAKKGGQDGGQRMKKITFSDYI
jgi:hypothetical protein